MIAEVAIQMALIMPNRNVILAQIMIDVVHKFFDHGEKGRGGAAIHAATKIRAAFMRRDIGF